MPYNTLREARMRLRNTVISYNNRPVYIDRIVKAGDANPNATTGRTLTHGNMYGGRRWIDVTRMEEADEDPNALIWNEIRVWLGWSWLEADENWDEFLERVWENIARHNIEIERRRTPREDEGGDPDEQLEPQEITLYFTYVGDEEQGQTNLMDGQLNIQPVRLGMLNQSQVRCFYVERMPSRRFLQGTNLENVRITMPGYNGPIGGGGVDVMSPQFRDMILGNYPTQAECLDHLVGAPVEDREGSGVPRLQAFHRHFALSFDDPLSLTFLHYKNRRIGYSNDGETFVVPDKLTYLRETLEQAEVRVA